MLVAHTSYTYTDVLCDVLFFLNCKSLTSARTVIHNVIQKIHQ